MTYGTRGVTGGRRTLVTEVTSMMYPGTYMTGAMGGWMVLWLIVSLAVVAVCVALIVRATSTTAQAGSGEAKRILDARLARGEIDPQDYRDRVALIGG